MSFVFEDAESVEANPFEEIVSQIANQKDAKGNPVAKKFPYPAPIDDDSKKALSKTLRQLSEAGAPNGVTVKKDVSDPIDVTEGEGENAKTVKKVVIRFWTIPQQKRPRKKTSTDVPPVNAPATPATPTKNVPATPASPAKAATPSPSKAPAKPAR